MARPSKLEQPGFVEEFLEWVDDGMPIKYCCEGMKVSEQSFYTWKKIADEDETESTKEYLFLELIKEHHARYLRKSKHKITNGEPGWQGQAWWLERTDHFFMPPKTDATTTGDEKVIVKPTVRKKEK